MNQPVFTFVFPSFLNGRLFQGFDYHLGTGHIRAYLAKHGLDTRQFVNAGHQPLVQTANKILETNPRIVGFSCYDNNYHVNRSLAEVIRRLAPEVLIVFGGPSATFSDELIMKDCAAIDICCRSYAEETCLELAERVLEGSSLYQVPGITLRRDGAIVRNPGRRASVRHERAVTFDGAFQDIGGQLDIFPNPYVEGFLPIDRVDDIGFVTSRGCTFACTFCNFSAMSGRSFSAHSLNYVMGVFDHLEHELKRRGLKILVTLNDDNFSLQGRRFHELIQRMGEAEYLNLTFWAEMRAETLRPESFELLKRAGFAEINFGLESATPHVLAAMKKVRSSGWERDQYAKEERYVERIRWAVESAKSANLRTTVSVILGGPGETSVDGQKTLDFISELSVESYAHNFLAVSAGTELASTHKDWGIAVEIPPRRVLPFRTSVSYDVYQLKILEHDRAWLPMTGFEMREAHALLCGTLPIRQHGDFPRGNGRGGSGRRSATPEIDRAPNYSPIIGIFEDALSDDAASWLATETAISSSVWLLHNSTAAKSKAFELINDYRVAVQELNTLTIVEGVDGLWDMRVNELSPDAPNFNTRIIHRLNAAVTSQLPNEDSRSVLQVVLNSSDDVRAFIAMNPKQDDATLVNASLIKRGAAVEDGCRWCSSPCPAGDGQRLLLKRTGEISPCMSGGSIGSVHDPLETVLARARGALSSEYKRRGCDSCPVESTCSKCLFPSPYSVEEFCELQRHRNRPREAVEGLLVAKLVGDISLDRKLEVTSLQAVDAGSIETGENTIPFSSCILVKAGSEHYIYSHKDEFLAAVSVAQAAALKIVASFADPSGVAKSTQSQFGHTQPN